MESLNFVIDADCSPAIGALRATENALDSLAGKRASVGIQTDGVPGAIRDLQAVRTAARDASGDVRVGADTSGVRQASSDLGALSNDFRAASKEIDSLSGSRSLGFSDSGAVRGLVNDLGAANRSVSSMNNELQRTNNSMSRTSVTAGGVGGSIGGVGSAAERTSGSLGRMGNSGTRSAGAVRNAIDDIGGSAEKTESRMSRLGSSIRSALEPSLVAHAMYEPKIGGPSGLNVPAGARPITGPVQELRPSIRPGAQRDSDQRAAERGARADRDLERAPSNVPPKGPPMGSRSPGPSRRPPPHTPSGGGGEDEGGGGGRFGRMHGMVNMLQMASLVGVLEPLVAGAAGMMAANEVIKNTPALAYAANGAMNQLTKGIRESSQAAIADGVPALHQLGGVMHDLGSEVGAIGAEHMGETLGAVSSLAQTATRDLAAMDPAISSGIAGLKGVGNALMDGISSPSSVQSIKSTGDALADASNDRGIQNLTSGIGTVAGLTGKVATDLAGDVGNLPGMGNANLAPAIQGGVTAGVMTRNPMIGGLTAAAIFQAQQEEAAGRGDLVTPGVLGGIGGGLGGYKLGGAKGGVAGYILGDAAAVGGAQADKALGTGSLISDVAQFAAMGAGIGAYGGPWGAAAGGLLGGAVGFAKNQFSGDSDTGTSSGIGGATDPGFFPQTAGMPSSWQQDAKGSWVPATDSKPIEAPSTQSGMPGRAGMIGPRSSQSDVPKAPPPLPPGPPIKDDGAKNLGDSIGRLGSEVQKATPPAQQLGAQYQHSSEQIKQLPDTMKPTMAALQTVPAQMNTAMQSAANNVSSGGEAIGSQVPKSMATGVAKNTNQACNAAADMSNSTVKCAKSALDSASPSKKFIVLGEGIGQGLAIGVRGSSGAAAAAVGQAMGKVVAAGQAGLQAASPSKTFAQMGANAMNKMAQGVGGIAPTSGAARIAPTSGGRFAADQAQANQAKQQAEAATAQARSGTKALTDQQRAEQAHEQALKGNAMTYNSPVANANIVRHNREAEQRAADRKVRHEDAIAGSLKGISPQRAGQERIARDQAQLKADYDQAHRIQSRADQNRGAREQSTITAQGMRHTSGLQSASDAGAGLSKAMTGGLLSQQSKASAGGATIAHAAASGAKKKAKVQSPSLVMAEVGRSMADGLVIGLMAGSGNAGAAAAGLTSVITTQINADGLRGFAASGLKLGFVMGENLVTGTQQVLQKNLLTALAPISNVSQQAMSALAATGLGAPAGSGASTWAMPNGLVTFAGAGSAANPISAPAATSSSQPAEQHFHINIDGQPIHAIAQMEVREALQQLMSTMPRQRG